MGQVSRNYWVSAEEKHERARKERDGTAILRAIRTRLNYVEAKLQQVISYQQFSRIDHVDTRILGTRTVPL
jgi:transcription termination factor NusB